MSADSSQPKRPQPRPADSDPAAAAAAAEDAEETGRRYLETHFSSATGSKERHTDAPSPRALAITACFGGEVPLLPPELWDVYARSMRVDLKDIIFSSKDEMFVADALAALLNVDRFAAPYYDKSAGVDRLLEAARIITSEDPKPLSRTCWLLRLPDLPGDVGRAIVLSDGRTSLDMKSQRYAERLPDAFWLLPIETRSELVRGFVTDLETSTKICKADNPNEIGRQLLEVRPELPSDLRSHLERRLALLPAIKELTLADLARGCPFFSCHKYFIQNRASTDIILMGRRVDVDARGTAVAIGIRNALLNADHAKKLLLIGGDSGTGKTEGMLHSIEQNTHPQHFGLYVHSVPAFKSLDKLTVDLFTGMSEDKKRELAVKLGDDLIEHCLSDFPKTHRHVPGTHVTVLIDEVGGEQLFLHVLCRTVYQTPFPGGKTFFQAFAEAMKVDTARVVCAGTGIQGVNLAPGSNPCSYHIIDACEFQESIKQKLVATLPRVWQTGIDRPETLHGEYLGALATNARCCAIMLEEVRRLTASKPGDAMLQRLSLVALTSLHATVMVRYKQLNGWDRTSLDEYLGLMCDALTLSAYPLQSLLTTACDTLLRKGAMTDRASLDAQGQIQWAGLDRYHVAEAQRAIFAVLLTGVSVRKQCAEGCEDAVLDMVALQLEAANRRAAMILSEHPEPAAARGWLTPKQLFWMIARWTSERPSGQAVGLELVIDLLAKRLSMECAAGAHADCPLTFYRGATTQTSATAERLLGEGKTLVLRNAPGAAGPDGFILIPTIAHGRLSHVLEISIQSKWFTSQGSTLSKDDMLVELFKMGMTTPRGHAASIVAAWKSKSRFADASEYLLAHRDVIDRETPGCVDAMIAELATAELDTRKQLPRAKLIDIIERIFTSKAIAVAATGAFTRALLSQEPSKAVSIASRAIVAVFSEGAPGAVTRGDLPPGVALVHVPYDKGVFQAWPIAFHGRRDDPRIDVACDDADSASGPRGEGTAASPENGAGAAGNQS